MPPARPSDRPTPAGETILDRFNDTFRGGAAALGWLLAVIVIALGAAGVVAGMDTPRADGVDRSGRNARGDAAVDAALDGVETDLQALAGAVHELSQQGRMIIASVSGNDTEAAAAATERGTQLVADIKTRAAAIRDELGAVPLIGTPAAAYEVSRSALDRHAAYLGSLDATDGLEEAWTRLTVGSLSATRMSELLAAHDAAVAAAAEAGRDADYEAALARLDEADAAIAGAKELRDRLAATVDVTTLDQWLARSAGYDVALRKLYTAIRDSGGRITAEVRTAMRGEQRAQALLPPDTRSLVLIMSDIGRGGMNAAGIDIETAADDLDEALAPASPEPP
jgi:hypothetical protein